jgi:hypothetical protein
MDQIVESCRQTTLAPSLDPVLPCLLLHEPCYDVGLNKECVKAVIREKNHRADR